MEQLFHYTGAGLINVMLVFFRISALFMVAPIYGNKMVPTQFKILLAMTVTFVISPYSNIPVAHDIHTLSMVGLILEQIAFGALIGYTLQLIYNIFVNAGQIIAMQSGLGFASFVEPTTGVSMPIFSQVYLLMITLVFLLLDGHLLFLGFITDSIVQYSRFETILTKDFLWQVIVFSSWLFKGAMLIVLPAIISLLVVNLSFAVITRAAPQINIFAVGFPITLTIGIILFYIGLSSVPDQIAHFTSLGYQLITKPL